MCSHYTHLLTHKLKLNTNHSLAFLLIFAQKVSGTEAFSPLYAKLFSKPEKTDLYVLILNVQQAVTNSSLLLNSDVQVVII